MRMSPSRLSLLAVTIIAGWQLASPAPASAQDRVCIPQAVGVPGNSGPPIWWDPSELYSTTEPTDKDPRWKGALRIAHGSGFVERVALRALHHPSEPDGLQHLFLSFKVENANFDQAVQRVLVGLGPDCSSRPVGCDADLRYVIATDINHMEPGAGTRTVAEAPSWFPAYLYQFSEHADDGQDLYTLVDNPPWMSRFRLWFAPDPSERTWTVNMLIPVSEDLDDGLPLREEFIMTYAVRLSTGIGGGIAVESWPREQDCDGNCTTTSAMTHSPAFSQARAPQLEYWGAFSLGNTGSCVQGISLASSDIGILPDGGDPLTATLGHEISRTDENIFVARPENQTGDTIPAETLQATFRLANWGSTPTGGTAIDTGEWLDIYFDRDPAPEVLNEDSIADGNKGVLQTEWHPETPTEMCYYDAPGAGDCTGIEPRGKHQCLLVELKSHGGDYLFTNESVHRNMNFVDVEEGRSSIEMQAFVTPKGAKPAGDERSHIVYLQVDLRHMPLEVNPKEYELMLRELERKKKGWLEERGGFGDLARFMPTAVVHVYHETGEQAGFGRKEAPVMQDQASFGLFVDPPREVIPLGWGLAIDGAVQVAPNLYRMKVSDEGVAIVRVRMKALTKEDGKLAPADPKWRSESHKDTRCLGLDKELCMMENLPKSTEPRVIDLREIPSWALEAGGDEPIAGDPLAGGGCQSAPGSWTGAGAPLMLGFLLLLAYGLRRRALARRAHGHARASHRRRG